MRHLTALALIAALLTAGCRDTQAPAPAPPAAPAVTAPHAPPVTPAPTLEIYELPRGYGESIIPILDSLIDRGEHRVGRVSRMPGGQVAVLAPPSVHAGIANMLQRLDQADAPDAPETITLTYWLVAARDAQTSNADALGEIAPALEGVVEAMGPMEFALVERSRLLSLNGESAEVNGRMVHIQQRVSAMAGAQLIGDLRISTRRGAEIQTRVNIKPKQLLVLGQSGFTPHPEDGIFPDQIGLPKPGDDLSLFFIIRAESASP